jgi:hypothetical protein
MKRRSKESCEVQHAITRLDQRFGLGIEALARIKDHIHRGIAKPIRRQSLRVTVFEVEVEGRVMHAVYDKKRKQVITVLYPELRAPARERRHVPSTPFPRMKHHPGRSAAASLKLVSESGTYYTMEDVRYAALVVQHRLACRALFKAMDDGMLLVDCVPLKRAVEEAWSKIYGDPKHPINRMVDHDIEHFGLDAVALGIDRILKTEPTPKEGDLT